MVDRKVLQDTAKKHASAQYKGKNALVAFINGGAFAVVVQLFMMLCMGMFDLDKDTAISVTVVMVILVTALPTGFGVYDKAVQKCGVSLFIPISGFANCLTSCAIKGRIEGSIFGIGSNIFKLAGLVLTYEIAAALVFGTIRYLLPGARYAYGYF